jgi:hypothetical protein
LRVVAVVPRLLSVVMALVTGVMVCGGFCRALRSEDREHPARTDRLDCPYSHCRDWLARLSPTDVTVQFDRLNRLRVQSALAYLRGQRGADAELSLFNNSSVGPKLNCPCSTTLTRAVQQQQQQQQQPAPRDAHRPQEPARRPASAWPSCRLTEGRETAIFFRP